MSVGTYVVGFMPPDKMWKKKKAAWDACEAAGIKPPDELQEFFRWEAPDNLGKVVDLGDACQEWNPEDGGREGIEVDISKLPSGVKFIRFYMSW